ncbi:MAG: leucine-rich repeat domain-containing protein [Sedimentisphaeraceae bacterium JB056]
MNISKIFLFILLSFGSVFAGIVKDEVLKEELAKQSGKNNDLTFADLLKIKEVSIHDKDIKTLEGLENCYNLEKLELRDCGIEDISCLSSIRKLKYLELSNNPITDLKPLENLARLEFLSLSHFETEDLQPLSNLTDLKELRLSNNEITDITALGSLINLESLSLMIMPVSDIKPISKLKKLESFCMLCCDVSDVSPIAHLESIKSLYLCDNRIYDINPLEKMILLETLHLWNNYIEDVSVLTKLNNLEKVSLIRNPLSSNYPSIKKQILANNPDVELDDDQRVVCGEDIQVSCGQQYIAVQAGVAVSDRLKPYFCGRVKVVDVFDRKVYDVADSAYTIAVDWTLNNGRQTLYYATSDTVELRANKIKRGYIRPEGGLVYDSEFEIEFTPFLMSNLSVSPNANIILAYKNNSDFPRDVGTLIVWDKDRVEFNDVGLLVSPKVKIGWLDEKTALVLTFDSSCKGVLKRIDFDDMGHIVNQISVVDDCLAFPGVFNGEPFYVKESGIFYGDKPCPFGESVKDIMVGEGTIAVVKYDSVEIYDKQLTKIQACSLDERYDALCYSGKKNALYGRLLFEPEQGVYAQELNKLSKPELFYKLEDIEEYKK